MGQNISNSSMNSTTASAMPNSQPPQFQITQQDYLRYSQDALALLSRIQQSKNVTADAQQKDNFIRKFIIHQKTQAWKQQMGLPTTTNNNNNNQSNVPNSVPNNVPNSGPNNFTNANANANVPMNNMGNNAVNPTPANQANASVRMPYNSMLPTMNQSPQLQQRMANNVQPNTTSATMNINQHPPVNNQPGATANTNNNGINPANFNQILPPPTEEMKVKLRQLIEEVSRNNNVLLKDQTHTLSAMDKNIVRESIMRISQQYADVDKIISYFFLLTRNTEGTKRLIQMKFMTKNILESSARNVYLAGPDLLEKLRVQYQKYFDYVKDQFQLRRQNLQNNQQAVPNQKPNQPGQNMAAMGVSQTQGPGPDPSISDQPQQMLQGNQQFQPQMNMKMAMPQGQPPLPQQQQQQQQPNSGQMPVSRTGLVPGGPQQFTQPVGMDSQWQISQRNANVSSSPMVPQSMSPIMVNHQSPPPQIIKPGGKTVATPKKKPSISGGRRKTSTKGPVNVNSIPTPAGANIGTPGSTAMKTPNSIPTPQVHSHSNKNTPQAQSPTYNAATQLNDSIATTDIFTSNGDTKLTRRRDLSNSDPEKFFYAALANLLELDEPTNKGAITGIYTPQPTPQLLDGGLNVSPYSPLKEWTCEIKHEAITSSFRQIDSIREMVCDDIIDDCSKIIDEDVKPDFSQGIKRERSITDNEIDTLFGDEKKPRLYEDDFKFVHEPIAFDDWKLFIVSGIE
jgi:mediator of RNA polymerase II transcription subunit 15